MSSFSDLKKSRQNQLTKSIKNFKNKQRLQKDLLKTQECRRILINLVMVMLLLDFCLLHLMRICLGQKLGIMVFKGVGGWYIEECPTTVGKKCPVCEYNSTLWNSGIEANKEIARKQKRRLVYMSNV